MLNIFHNLPHLLPTLACFIIIYVFRYSLRISLLFYIILGTNSPSSPLSCSSPKLLLSPQQGPFSLQNLSSKLKNANLK